MTGLSTVVLEEGKITGSFIKVHCKKMHYENFPHSIYGPPSYCPSQKGITMYLNWIKEFFWYLSKGNFSIHCLRSCNLGFCTELNKFLDNPTIFTNSPKDIGSSSK
jgi:hypothetical protein